MAESSVRRALFWYTAAALVALAAAAWVLQLWRADLRIPFVYGADGRLTALFVEGMLENGWYLENARVGAPGQLHLGDFPMSDHGHLLVIKLIGLAVPDTGMAINLYFLLTFPLAAVSALFVLRRLGISYGPALVAGVLYSLLPYHFLRGVNHLFLSGYYLVPLVVLLAVKLYAGSPILLRRDETGWRLDLLGRPTLAALALAVVLPAAGIYYAVFACGFWMVAALASAVRRRAWQPLLGGMLLVGLCTAAALACLSPTLLYQRRHGPNPTAAHAGREGGELYGLKLAQLVLPVTGHRVHPLAKLKAKYNAMMPLVNENDCAALGAVASAGFLVLLARALLRRRLSAEWLDALGVLNVAAVLGGTVGGFGGLFSFLVLPAIRGYNRLSIFIAFFGLAVAAWGLDRLTARWAGSARGRWAAAGLLGLVLALGTLDQTSRRFTPDHAALQALFAEDAAFVAAVEERLPAGAAVMQLPYVPFPEHPPVHGMTDYDHLRGYMHSRTLRWSYGAMKGREADAWQAAAARQPVSELLATLRQAEFRGLYLDRAGYADQAEELIVQLQEAGLGEPLRSASGRLLFFDLAGESRPRQAARTEDAGRRAASSRQHAVRDSGP